MTPKELDDLCAVCKANRVHIFTDGHTKLVFHLPEEERRPSNGAPAKKPKNGPSYTELLLAATEGYPVEDETDGS